VIVEEYKESVIPFKPSEVFSKPELDLSTSDGDAATPIWVELNEQIKLKKQQEQKEKKKR
jgi:rare lipoprotein A